MEFDFNDPAIIQAIKDAGFVPESDVKGLKAKRDELLAKVASGKATAEELEKAQAKLKEIEQRKLEEEEKYGEALAMRDKEAQALKADLETKNRELTNQLIDGNLVSALVENNVSGVYLEAAKAMLRNNVDFKDGKVVAGDKAVAEYIKEWAESDSGKPFVAAPSNNGGGAPGSKGKTPTNKKWAEYTETELVDIYKSDPESYKKIKATQ